ncbi:MAG: membrane protein insertion efficiency factor YidD [Zetaproteobacteria bacterium]|nr:membrane protein insertion efficiency factor YidD [Pseudobdellovibrionaceae bacterium]
MKYILILMIRIYQLTISPLLGPHCRFYPSCSHYGLLCLKKFPTLVAINRIVRRLIKCHPWHPGGVDLP